MAETVITSPVNVGVRVGYMVEIAVYPAPRAGSDLTVNTNVFVTTEPVVTLWTDGVNVNLGLQAPDVSLVVLRVCTARTAPRPVTVAQSTTSVTL